MRVPVPEARRVAPALSVTPRWAAASSASTSKTSPQPTSQTRGVHVTSLENRLKEKLGTKVSLTYRDGKGALTIKYFSDDDLERILNILDVET